MDEFNAGQAAAHLGITREAVDLAAREGRLAVVGGDGPRRFSREALEEFHRARLGERIAALARSQETPVSVAAKVRRGLHERGNGLPRSVSERLNAMPIVWRSVFSQAELAAAAVRDGDGCRWCQAQRFAEFKGLRPSEFSPALRELFGADPCRVCAPALLGPYMAVLAARVRGGAVRPSEPAPRPSEAERAAAQEWASVRAVTASAAPVADDGGKALVAQRLRTVRARLKDARRRQDVKSALELQRQLQALTADASRVDGRAAAPRGRSGSALRLRTGL
ncbi:hypothetical protein P1S61_36995 [Streptomyces sp. ME08-AFT2]|uniref:hypothetical protein n=1 Tax=Streptomyces sp. ME08-AFT2 TaxID=3028683 RepID=UPI0029A576F9|nr:hypothetical protein [Streptomyces sp. ME08-AFT2]MDX3314557.1 hypothetical protein [Streptomyces sp. ME08-AFT2]